ncbi:MAG: hypothetical protein EA353_02630 [Puniceicoccaceae bacterium]|nr:MAG: hypothetical protein EA353_02630 [Puniceicoccaceae bacterium]
MKFSSWDSYSKFRREITSKSRYIYSEETNCFLAALKESAQKKSRSSKWDKFFGDKAFLNVVEHIRQALPKDPTKPTPDTIQVATAPASKAPHVRSSNLSVRKEFSEADQDRFMDESFDYIAKFFEGSLDELERRNPEIEATFKRIDAACFTARIYKNGRAVSKCSICHGESIYGNGITYSHDENSRGNSFNDWLCIEVGDQSLSLSTSGMPSLIHDQPEKKMTQQGAAEHFWALLIKPLQ